MELVDLTYQGPPIDDFETFRRLPENYRKLLEQINGFVQFGGGLHIRGACTKPIWHAIATVWSGTLALSSLFPVIKVSDIPFGQDALGDQFILRDGIVHQLWSETGELESLNCELLTFLNAAQTKPVEYLDLQPLIRFYEEGETLEPGQLLNVYPPFCAKESAAGVEIKAVPFDERIRFLADFAAKIAGLGDGEQITINIEP